MICAAIDIGSNTFRLLIARPNSDNASTPWQTVFYTHRIIRLGEGLHQSGKLGEAGMQRALAAFHEFAAILKQHRVVPGNILAVATAAMRDAQNGAAFRQQVAEETGINIQIIAGDEEAAMSLAGACAVLPESTREDMLLFDIGGGSTEFIRARHAQAQDAISRKLGVVRLTEACLHSDPPSANDYQAMMDTACEHLQQVEDYWQDGCIPKHLVGTAGTVTTLAATELDLCPYNAEIINNHVMERHAFLQLRNRLLAMNHIQRQNVRTIEQGRADLMVAGLAIVETVMNYWNYERMIVVDAGLLEGAWLAIHSQSNQSK